MRYKYMSEYVTYISITSKTNLHVAISSRRDYSHLMVNVNSWHEVSWLTRLPGYIYLKFRTSYRPHKNQTLPNKTYHLNICRKLTNHTTLYNFQRETRLPGVAGIAAGWPAAVRFPTEARGFVLLHNIQTDSGLTQSLLELVQGNISPELKRLGSEADHTPTSSTEAKNSPLTPHSRTSSLCGVYLIKHMDNFTSTYFYPNFLPTPNIFIAMT